ncbi:MAG: GNAT family N-acetyltransferase [Dermatophilaceae bacterium]
MSEPEDVAPTGGPGYPGTAVVIRAALPGDADALVELRGVMFEAVGADAAALADPGWQLAAHRWFVDRVDATDARVIVAEVSGAVVACAVGEVIAVIPGPSCTNGSVGLLSNVTTFPDHRGDGHAAACTDAVLGWFEESTDVDRLDLFATPEGARIYSSRGFVRSDFPAMHRTVARD